MDTQNPATLPKGTIPGVGTQGASTTPAASSAPTQTTGISGEQQGATQITISAEEYRNLKRHEARQMAFEKRKQFTQSRNSFQPKGQMSNVSDDDDPEIVEQLRIAQDARDVAERKVLTAELTNKTRELLEKEEFKTLPKSTRALILKNPHMVSGADNIDEALLDIEDFVREQIIAELALPNKKDDLNKGGSNPPGHETPPNVNAGVPGAANAEGLEDVSKLTGTSRSRAVLKNAMKRKAGVQA